MKAIIIRKLFGDQPARQYLTLSIAHNSIREKAFLEYDGISVDVSARQFVVCQVPFLVGIWIGKTFSLPVEFARLRITDAALNELVTIFLKRVDVVDLHDGKFALFTILRSQYGLIHWIHQKAVLAYFYYKRENKVTYQELDGFCATYLFPRKVILTCFGHSDNYNLFPMDLQGFIEEENVFVLALRNSSVTLDAILRAKKVVVCDVGADRKEILYSLGKHHSSRPPLLADLPFSFEHSKVFKMLVPDIANGYRELEIVHHMNLGSHTLMLGKVMSHQRRQEQQSLHHVHIVYAIKNKVSYDLV